MVIVTPALTAATKNLETFGGVVSIRCTGRLARKLKYKDELPTTDYHRPLKFRVWDGTARFGKGVVLLVKKPFKNLSLMVLTLSEALGMQPTPSCIFNESQKKILNAQQYSSTSITHNIIIYPRGVRPCGRDLPLFLSQCLEKNLSPDVSPRSPQHRSKLPPAQFNTTAVSLPASPSSPVQKGQELQSPVEIVPKAQLSSLKNPKRCGPDERLIWKRGVAPAVRLRSVQPPRIPHVDYKVGDEENTVCYKTIRDPIPQIVRSQAKKNHHRLKQFLQGSVNFPIALIPSKGGDELPIRIDGGGVTPGSLASTSSGDLYKIEWVTPDNIHARRVLRYNDIQARMSGAAVLATIPPDVCFLIDTCCNFAQGSLLPTSGISYLFWADLQAREIEPCCLHESRSVCPSCNHRKPTTSIEDDKQVKQSVSLPLVSKEVLVF